MTRIASIVEEPARLAAREAECELWDVEYVKEGGRWYLRILIEREGGVYTEHCERVSRAIEPLLDEKDPIKDPYILEVSSAGLERTLKRPEHYERCAGKEIELSFYSPQNGSKTLRGVLNAFDGDGVTVGGNRFDMKDIAKAKLVFNF